MKNKHEKIHASVKPGIAVKVVDGDIGLALRLFKQQVKKSNHLEHLKEIKEYKKPTTVRREFEAKRKLNAKIFSRQKD